MRSNGVKNRTHQDNLFIVAYLYLKFIYLTYLKMPFRNRTSITRLIREYKMSAYLPLGAESSTSRISGFLISDFFRSRVIAFSTIPPMSKDRSVGAKDV